MLGAWVLWKSDKRNLLKSINLTWNLEINLEFMKSRDFEISYDFLGWCQPIGFEWSMWAWSKFSVHFVRDYVHGPFNLWSVPTPMIEDLISMADNLWIVKKFQPSRRYAVDIDIDIISLVTCFIFHNKPSLAYQQSQCFKWQFEVPSTSKCYMWCYTSWHSLPDVLEDDPLTSYKHFNLLKGT